MTRSYRHRATAFVALSLGCGLLLVPVAIRSIAADETAKAERHFASEIAPLLVRRCVECHGGAAKKGRLDLTSKETSLAGGSSGKAIVPGKPVESLLWQYVESDEMPKNRPPLSPQEKRLLRQWIEEGAVWSGGAIGTLAGAEDRLAAGNWLRRLTIPEYIETVRSVLGVDVADEARRLLPPDLRADGFSNTAYNLSVDLGHVEAYAKLAQFIAGRLDVDRFAAEHSENRELTDAPMRKLIAGMGLSILRGPLDDREIAAYLDVSRAVAKEGGDFTEATRYIVEAMLQSPRFLYRIERQRGERAPGRAGDYELASRLSYILWGGPPDKELMRAAEAGGLRQRDQVEKQVQRMLKDPRVIEQSARFIQEWLHLDRLAGLRPNPERFPDWNERLAADMRDETLAFFKHVAWEKQRPLAELMNAQVTFATPRLARHYDLNDGGSRDSQGDAKKERPRVTNGLVALYTFEEGSGEMVRDRSGAGNPLDLKIADPAAVRWTDGGLEVHRTTLIAAPRPPSRLIDAIRGSGAITIEAWVTPAKASQTGPARIVTLSADPNGRNFTLGQDGDKFDVRFRTTKTDANGTPSLAGPGGAVGAGPTHVVYTRDAAGKAKLYVAGNEQAARDVAGDLKNWDGGFRFALANEQTRDRTWLGTFHLVAIYERALSTDEVRQNRAAGPRDAGPPEATQIVIEGERAKGLQALYQFDEGGGDEIRDSSDAGEPLNLKIEDASAVAWDGSGLTVKGPTLIAAAEPPKRLIAAIKKSHALTLEAWITPADAKQKGPARIITLSSGTGQRNFTLGQEGDKFDVRLRATKADGNGMPSLASPSGTVQTRLTHLAYTREASGRAKLYINGEQQAARDIGGDLSNWDGSFRLALANETTKDRAWRGTLHGVAIYSRALTPEEARAGATLRMPRAQLARYDLSSEPARGGLLTQASVLTVGGDEASMVARGLFVLRDLLHSGVDDPPPCVDTTPVPPRAGLSQRAIAEQRLSNRACSGCHGKFEPFAFGLERFGGIGVYREVDEHGNQLRSDGQVQFPDEEQTVSFASSAELMDLLAASPRVQKNFTRKVTQFALGRPLAAADQPILDEIHAAAQKGGGTYASLITAIVLSDLVQTSPTETSP